jgi:predicted amidohydrolase YtcJ
MAEAYIAAEAAGVLAIDMNIFFLAQPDSWRALKDDFLKLREQIDNLGPDSHLTGRTIKIILDGALSAGTAALLSPYLDDPTSHGLYTWNDDELLDAAAYFDAEGFQLHIHAIGDGAIRQGLDVIEKVVRINPLRDRRPVIAHAQLIDADDLPRFAELDVIANYQPLWTYLDPMNKILIAPRIGDDRNNRQYQLASMLKSGARIAYGSDWPVTSQIPLEALAVPTHRQSPDRQPEGGWSPHESISVEQSLSFYTHGVAYQNYKEDRYGEIKVGAEADLMILSQNPLTCDPHDVSKISVVTVYKRGKVIKSH